MFWKKDTAPVKYDPKLPYLNPSYIEDTGNEYFGWCKMCTECGHSWSPQLSEHHKEDCSHYEE